MDMDIKTIENPLHQSGKLQTATFGMGCFWGPEARFGSLSGVIRTRVGYAGGGNSVSDLSADGRPYGDRRN